MSIHYNAFISYKHAELDNRVAEDIQRSLERFPVPHAIKKKTGKRKIERIFRDKDELPITSDLTSNISDALENSDYLIVICSPNTAKSTWVKREIAYFLKNHTMNQVLTVLAGGESQEVIPGVLRNKEETITDENGEEHTITVPVEPLACDYRIPFGRAHKEEIPRLAAVLLGCSYDELVRRQRQYKMRQFGIIFSIAMILALGFGGYMMYSKVQIDKNYQQALINQSRFLANESIRLYDNNQRVDALHLALASLPDSENDKHPVTAESIKALIKATGAYSSPSGTGFQWDYRMRDSIEGAVVSDDGNHLASYDSHGNLMVWHTKDHKLILDLAFTDIESVGFANNDTLIIWGKKNLYCYSLSDGTEKWSYTLTKYSFAYVSLRKYQLLVVGDGTIILPLDNNSLYRFDLSNGTVTETIGLDEFFIDGYHSFYNYSNFVLSPDGKKLAMLCQTEEKNFLFVRDLPNKNTKHIEIEYSGYALKWVDNEHLLRDFHNPSEKKSVIQTKTFSTSYNDIQYIQCINANDLSEFWCVKVETRGGGSCVGFYLIPGTDNIVCYLANACYVYNIKTGEKLYGGTSLGTILYSTVINNKVTLISDSGTVFELHPEISDDMFMNYNVFFNNIDAATYSNGFYLVPSDHSSIIFYDDIKGDDELKQIENGTMSIWDVYSKCSNEDYLAFLLKDLKKEATIKLFNLNSCSYEDSISITTEKKASFYKLLKIYKNRIYYSADDEFYSVDIKSKEIKKLPIGDYAYIMTCSMQNNIITYAEKKENFGDTKVLSTYNLDDGTKKTFSIDFSENSYSYISSLPKTNLVFYSDKSNGFIVDMDKNTFKTINSFSSDSYAAPICENNSGTMLAIGNTDRISILDDGLNIVTNIDCKGLVITGLSFEKLGNNETLFAASQSGELLLFDPLSGKLQKSVVIGSNSKIEGFFLRPETDFLFDHKKQILYLQIGKTLSVIDTRSWIQIFYLDNCWGYTGKSDKFLIRRIINDHGDISINYFPHYSIEELKNKANKLLNGQEMSPEKKLQYGITD